MASEIRVDKITSLSGVGTITPSSSGIDITGITTVATLKATTGIVTTLTATTGIVTTLTANTVTSLGAVSGTTGTFSGDVSIADKIVHTGDTDTAIRFSGADTITLETQGKERVFIKSDGKIGINTNTPAAPLEVQGDDGVNDAAIYFTRHGNPSNNGVIGQLLFRNGTDSVAIIQALKESANDDAYISMLTQPTGGSIAERLRILSNGEVGINVSDPDSYGQNGHGYRGLTVQAPAGGYSGITIRSNYAGGGILAFADGSGSNAELKNIALQADHVNKRLDIMVDGSSKARFTTNGFHPNPSDTAAANALDDYEEGTWTATLVPTSSEFTPTTNTNTCTYTKIGRQVTVVGIAKMTTPSSLGSYSNDSINHSLNVNGLPFTIANAINSRSAATMGVGGDIQFPNGVLATHGNANTTSFTVFVNKSNGGTRTSPTLGTSTAMNFHFSFTYFI